MKKKQKTNRWWHVLLPTKNWHPSPVQVGAWLVLFGFTVLTATAILGGGRVVAPGDLDHRTIASDLSQEDRGLYAMIFAAEAKGEHATADQWMYRLSNPGLVGYVLAERYLGNSYAARNDELVSWLSHYSDHPQAARIASLATQRGIKVKHPALVPPLRGSGYGDNQGRSTMPDAWFTALGDWREGNYTAAGSLFVTLSTQEGLSDWQRAAAHYWAYRAATKTNDAADATVHLAKAAAFPTTFYGLLAAQELNKVDIEAEAPEVADGVRNNPRAIRAALLVQLARTAEAEEELRALYSATSTSKRGGIVTLASELHLPNLQMRFSRTQGLSSAEMLFGRYPAPHYMMELHPVMDAALLLAVARNESGFRAVAESPAGAVGMMQMLPSTARVVERRVGESLLQTASSNNRDLSIVERLSNPATSARYGAEYLRMLLREPVINGNLIHLLVGYNAGAGTVANWKAAAGTMDDPLLYIESIPYAETRNYVMQVLAQYWIYQQIMDERSPTLAALSKGEWPELRVQNKS